jgi:hypothetical protein
MKMEDRALARKPGGPDRVAAGLPMYEAIGGAQGLSTSIGAMFRAAGLRWIRYSGFKIGEAHRARIAEYRIRRRAVDNGRLLA